MSVTLHGLNCTKCGWKDYETEAEKCPQCSAPVEALQDFSETIDGASDTLSAIRIARDKA